ncbi:MAG: response regulator [Acidobacteriota bacterium]|nr:response regulator [Acidobacteriota bacterium]
MAGSDVRQRPPLVLVVDDEASIVSAFTETLALDGYETAPASSAEQGLRLLDEGLTPDAVLLDLRMPGMGGLGFLLSLRAHPDRRLIPVAVVTADTHLDDTTQHAVRALGADLCFKPLNMQDVLALAAKLIRAGRQAEPGPGVH